MKIFFFSSVDWSAFLDWEGASFKWTEVYSSVVYTHRQALSQDLGPWPQIQTAEFNFLWVSSSPCLTDNKRVLPHVSFPLNSFFQPRSKWDGLLTCVCRYNAREGEAKLPVKRKGVLFPRTVCVIEFKTRHKLTSEYLRNNISSSFIFQNSEMLNVNCKILH